MTPRRARRLLWSLALVLAGGAVLVAAWGVAAPLGVRVPEDRPAATRPAAPPPAGEPPLAAFERLWDLPLRRPLYDAPPVRVEAAPVVKPPFPAKLAGSIVEPGQSQAMFAFPGGGIELKHVGDTVAGAEVLEINSDSVVVLYMGDRLTLKLESANAG